MFIKNALLPASTTALVDYTEQNKNIQGIYSCLLSLLFALRCCCALLDAVECRAVVPARSMLTAGLYPSKGDAAGNSVRRKSLKQKGSLAVAASRKSKTAQPANRFYRSAKLSEYQFKRVLWSFARDEPAGEAARQMTLSANSIDALYSKLRIFFTELGVFTDIYEGRNPEDGTPLGEDMEGYELRLIAFHLERVSRKRRMKPTRIDEVDYNWCESRWRFEYHILAEGRPSEGLYRMMFSHLLAHIRVSGPVGGELRNRDRSEALMEEQLDQRLAWLERNAPAFRDEASRSELRRLRRHILAN
ncbi:hypothetical protein QMO56_04340 [Roseomonas sp. E05]|uniref:hypothetical protein n=1 Tax=Roseomonas sp. E05 TaxID=3046310 RepID=UPI0024BA3169|nr:hypothetical protein [Roseomonas sp. E05]MDJ0387336.1 hypothetical protein [Roseomonas sp. E05]